MVGITSTSKRASAASYALAILRARLAHLACMLPPYRRAKIWPVRNDTLAVWDTASPRVCLALKKTVLRSGMCAPFMPLSALLVHICCVVSSRKMPSHTAWPRRCSGRHTSSAVAPSARSFCTTPRTCSLTRRSAPGWSNPSRTTPMRTPARLAPPARRAISRSWYACETWGGMCWRWSRPLSLPARTCSNNALLVTSRVMGPAWSHVGAMLMPPV
mmetsp:Transcript_8867/g.22305  ORF Transcript_8867/g.22305 Transcript_8867/m.22305 type:complete len:216 (+) Transcript_8867:574-1221(+)